MSRSEDLQHPEIYVILLLLFSPLHSHLRRERVAALAIEYSRMLQATSRC